jgi:hypothetical protein
MTHILFQFSIILYAIAKEAFTLVRSPSLLFSPSRGCLKTQIHPSGKFSKITPLKTGTIANSDGL